MDSEIKPSTKPLMVVNGSFRSHQSVTRLKEEVPGIGETREHEILGRVEWDTLVVHLDEFVEWMPKKTFYVIGDYGSQLVLMLIQGARIISYAADVKEATIAFDVAEKIVDLNAFVDDFYKFCHWHRFHA